MFAARVTKAKAARPHCRQKQTSGIMVSQQMNRNYKVYSRPGHACIRHSLPDIYSERELLHRADGPSYTIADPGSTGAHQRV